MPRIVAGLAKGRQLAVPPAGTRPTSDRAREGLFNALASLVDLDGARVLDLYAGSGAVGLEALSRGAGEVVLVEADRRAAQVIEANVATLGLPGAGVVRAPVVGYLGAASGPFDVVFADPPYDTPEDEIAVVLRLLVESAATAPGAIVVLERSARGAAPGWPDGLQALRERRYGEAVLWYGRRL